jgi:protoporphyrinogen oxidase
VPLTVLDKDAHFVGGISRTEEHRGYRFDIGGHRFFSKSQEIEDLWTEVLGDDLLTRGRLFDEDSMHIGDYENCLEEEACAHH